MAKRLEPFTDKDLMIVAAHLRAAQEHIRLAFGAMAGKVPIAKIDPMLKAVNGLGEIQKFKSAAENAYCQNRIQPPDDADHKVSWGVLFSSGQLIHDPSCKIE